MATRADCKSVADRQRGSIPWIPTIGQVAERLKASISKVEKLI